MQTPLQVTFKEMAPSSAIEADIRQRADRLERFFDRITSCRVVVEAQNRSHREGRVYGCTINLTVPGHEIAIGHEGPKDHAHEDVHVAVRDAFAAASRRLQDHARRARGDVKTHQNPSQA